MLKFFQEFSLSRLIDMFKLTAKHHLFEFEDIWVEIFFWCFMTSLFVHLIGSIVAFQSLRNHKIGRWYGALIFLAGIVTPIVSSTITTALLSTIFFAASVEIKAFFCFLLGIAQTAVVLIFAFFQILSSL